MVWLVCPAPPRALTLTLSRRAGEGMFVADEGVAAVRGWCWFSGSAANGCVGGLVGRGGSRTAPTGWPAGCMDGEGWVCWWFGWCAPPPRALTPGPHPSNGRGGMFVADECVAAVMGVLVVWLVGQV